MRSTRTVNRLHAERAGSDLQELSPLPESESEETMKPMTRKEVEKLRSTIGNDDWLLVENVTVGRVCNTLSLALAVVEAVKKDNERNSTFSSIEIADAMKPFTEEL